MSKHTAGPWKSQAMSRNGYLESARVIFDSQDNEICRIDYEGMPTGCEGIKRSEENAALLAAAPDLLAALNAIVAKLNEKSLDGAKRRAEVEAIAKLAIAKVGVK
jgi:hypothetical protein